MRRVPAAFAHLLLALGSFALLRSSTCAVAICIEDCDPCTMQCKCHHTCQHANLIAYEPAHKLVSFELLRSTTADGGEQLVCAWISGLSVGRATGRAEPTPRDLREFAE